MTAGRVNTKFVIILAAVLLLVAGVVVGAVFYVGLRDPQVYIARGDALAQDGQFPEALEEYSRAYRYDDTNPALLFKIAEMLQKSPVDNTIIANERVQRMNNCWKRIISLNPNSPDSVRARRELLQFSYRHAELAQSIGAGHLALWEQLYKLADEMVKQSAEDALARKYRGIAQRERMARLDLSREERAQARTDLDEALKADPNDAELYYQIGAWHLLEANEARRLNREDVAKQYEDAGVKIVADMLAAHPDSLDAQLAYARMMVGIRDRAKANAALTPIAERLLAEPITTAQQMTMTHEVADLLSMVDNDMVASPDGAEAQVRSGSLRAAQLLKHALDHHGDDLVALWRMARNTESLGKPEATAPYYEAILTDRLTRVDASTLVITLLQVNAASKLSTVYLAQAEQSDDAKLKAEMIGKTRVIADKIEKVAGASSGVPDLIRGKIAMTEGEYRLAAKLLTDADTKSKGAHFDALVLSATALERLGEFGAARERLKRAIEHPMGRQFYKAYTQLANICLRLQDYDQADHYAQAVLDADPTNSTALYIKSLTLAQKAMATASAARPGSTPGQGNKEIKEAIAILEKLGGEESRQMQVQLAGLYEVDGQRDRARLLLESMLDDSPADLMVLRQLIRMDVADDNKPQAVARIDKALASDPDNRGLHLLRDQLSGDSKPGNIEQLLEDVQDPYTRARLAHQYYRGSGDLDKAQQFLDEAASLRPEEEWVVRARFLMAIQRKDWEQARTIADEAARLNFDLAQGMFWFGHMELERGRYTQAISAIIRGLNQRPVYSEGWRLLAEARRRAGDMRGAEEAIGRALDIKPDDVSALQTQYMIHDALGNHQLALDDLRRAARFSPYDTTLYLQLLDYQGRHGSKTEALRQRQELAGRFPQDQANQRAIAELHVGLKQFDEAKQILDKLLVEHPDERANVMAMAAFLRAKDQPQDGKAMIEQYIARRGADAEVNDFLALARYLRDSGTMQDAVAAYNEAIKRESGQSLPASRELADWQFNQGQFGEAARLYGAVMDREAQGDNEAEFEQRVWLRYIESLVRSGDLDAAETSLKRYVSVHGPEVQTALLDGVIASSRGEPFAHQAARSFDQAIELAPDNAQAYMHRARFRSRWNDPATAAQVKVDLEKALSLNPQLTSAREMLVQWHLEPSRRDITSALDELRRIIEYQPNHEPAWLHMAEIYVDQKRYPELDRLVIDALARFPTNPVWYQIRARALTQQERLPEAVRELDKAYQVAPQPTLLAQFASALIDVKPKQPEEALKRLTEQSQWLENSSLLKSLQGRALMELNRKNEAIECFTRAFDLAQGGGDLELGIVVDQMRAAMSIEEMVSILEGRTAANDNGLAELIIAQLDVRRGKANEAVARLEALAARLDAGQPNRPAVLRTLAETYYRAQQYEPAHRAYLELLKVAPNDYSAMNNLAYMLAENLRQPAAALPYAERALQLTPNDPVQQASIRDTLGWVQFRGGRFDQAALTLRRCLAIYPLTATHIHLAQVLIAQNKKEAAREQLLAAQRLAAKNKEQTLQKQAEELLATLGDASDR